MGVSVYYYRKFRLFNNEHRPASYTKTLSLGPLISPQDARYKFCLTKLTQFNREQNA